MCTGKDARKSLRIRHKNQWHWLRCLEWQTQTCTHQISRSDTKTLGCAQNLTLRRHPGWIIFTSFFVERKFIIRHIQTSDQILVTHRLYITVRFMTHHFGIKNTHFCDILVHLSCEPIGKLGDKIALGLRKKKERKKVCFRSLNHLVHTVT